MRSIPRARPRHTHRPYALTPTLSPRERELLSLLAMLSLRSRWSGTALRRGLSCEWGRPHAKRALRVQSQRPPTRTASPQPSEPGPIGFSARYERVDRTIDPGSACGRPGRRDETRKMLQNQHRNSILVSGLSPKKPLRISRWGASGPLSHGERDQGEGVRSIPRARPRHTHRPYALTPTLSPRERERLSLLAMLSLRSRWSGTALRRGLSWEMGAASRQASASGSIAKTVRKHSVAPAVRAGAYGIFRAI